MKQITVEQMIRDTEALTYLNALKTAVSELKEELSAIEETHEFQTHAVERARRVMRRIDTQYRALVKSTIKVYNPPEVVVDTSIFLQQADDEISQEELKELMESE